MSLLELISRFRWRIGITVALVIVEAVLGLLLPLFIGLAINDLLVGGYRGLIGLGLVGVAMLVVGSVRRFVDTRSYAGIYEVVASELVERETTAGTETSAIAARASLLTEFVEFLENSMPQIVTAAIGTVGSIAIIAGLSRNVFVACLALLALIAVTYWMSAKRNFNLNSGYNDELERQVAVIEGKDSSRVTLHFRSLMAWNRKLSDLETINYVIIWLGVIALLVYAPIEVIEPGVTDFGLAFSTILYVFDYIEALIGLPLFIQQIIRLREISGRLSRPLVEPLLVDQAR